MRFLYTIYRAATEQILAARCDTTTRAALLTDANVTYPYYVIVDDTLENRDNIQAIRSPEELFEWKERLMRFYQWSDAADKPRFENLLEGAPSSVVVGTPQAQRTPIDNVKNAAGALKPPSDAVPHIALLALGTAMKDGADKYGRFNWRTSEVTASVFFNAMMRHLLLWYAGENLAKDSKVHHLAHLMAGAGIILDAELQGVLNDDRDVSSNVDLDALMAILKGS